MMKIQVITFHSAINYGAVLQCFALQKILNAYCDCVETIDYSTKSMKYRLIPKGKGFKHFIRCIITIPLIPAGKRRHRKFSDFVNKYLRLTKHYGSILELNADPPDGDLIITGSDQVFNPGRREEERKAFYLNFPCKNRVSYSASFGKSKISLSVKEEIKQYLNKFDAISVRENYALEIIKDLGINTATQTIDPVFLLEREKWREIEEPYPKLPDNFIFMFYLRESKAAVRVAKAMKEETSLPIVILTDKPNLPLKCEYVIRDASPQNFVWLIDHCSFCVEDSFHATAFSIIFRKQFIFCDDHESSNERGRALLDDIGLNKAYDYDGWEKCIQEKWDYDVAESYLIRKVNDSKLFIENCVKNIKA